MKDRAGGHHWHRVPARGALLGTVLLSLLGWTSLRQTPAALGATGWAPIASMHVARSHFTAVALSDGEVLAAGGETRSGIARQVTAGAEIFDPAAGNWTSVANLSTARADNTATLLADGRVLVAGGTDGSHYLAGAELFDPRTRGWSSAGSMTTARGNHSATLLSDGRVLVAGGFGAAGPLAGAEIYDPGTNSWTVTEALRVPRGEHAATLRSDGKVLVTGGFGVAGALNSVELYDPANGIWLGFQPLPVLNQARYGHSASLLANGRILVAGGRDAAGSLSGAELYDPVSGFWTPARGMLVPRSLHTATVLYDGQVLVTGGQTLTAGGSVSAASTEIYNPAFNLWSPAGAMSTDRYAHSAVLLPDGRLLVAGGISGGDSTTAADLYTPAILVPTGQAVTKTPTPLLPPPPPSIVPTALVATSTPVAGPTLSPQQTSTPVTGTIFRIRGIRVERYGSKPDWQMTRPSLGKAPVRTRVRLSIYVDFVSLAPGSHVMAGIQVNTAGHSVFRAGLRETRSGPGGLWEHWNFTPRQRGKYSVVGHVSVDNQVLRAATSFRATGRPQTISFNLDRVQTTNDKGQPKQSFARTDRAIVVVTFTVNGAPGSIPVVIGQQLEFSTPSGWAALGRRVENSFDTSNGTHTYTVSFVPQSPYSLLRMVIDLTIAGQKQRKAAVFSVHSAGGK